MAAHPDEDGGGDGERAGEVREREAQRGLHVEQRGQHAEREHTEQHAEREPPAGALVAFHILRAFHVVHSMDEDYNVRLLGA